MAPLPKKKTSHARQGERRAHMKLTAEALVNCPQCNMPKLPHHACTNCGTYNGREVIEIKAPKKKTS
jgi:large subunit ribosomal protein L32